MSSSSRIHPLIRDFTGKLAETRPSFRVAPNRVGILHQPTEFLDTLIVSETIIPARLLALMNPIIVQDMINRAEERIFISSLYIGAKETRLVRRIVFSHYLEL